MKTAQFLLISTIFIAGTFACNTISSGDTNPGIEIFPTDEPPGVGEKAEKGYAISEQVIAALEKYHTDQGSYPEKLAELVPEYLPSAPATTDEMDFSYSRNGDSYSFSFHYRGPGMNTCTYTPEEKWYCSGAY